MRALWRNVESILLESWSPGSGGITVSETSLTRCQWDVSLRIINSMTAKPEKFRFTYMQNLPDVVYNQLLKTLSPEGGGGDGNLFKKVH